MNRMDAPLQLGWDRFARVAALMLIFPALLLYFGSGKEDSGTEIAMSLSALILLAYLATGWHRLRHADARAPIERTQQSRIVSELIGPLLPAVLWMVAFVAPLVIHLLIFLLNVQR